MQDSNPDASHGAAEPSGLAAAQAMAAKIMRWATAALSVGLILATIIWAYRLSVRDAADLPVIKAMNEPARSRPEDPGGEIAENQGLEVNEVLAGEEASAPQESRSAPPVAALSEEDSPATPAEPEIPVVVIPPQATGDPQEAEANLAASTPDAVEPFSGSKPGFDGSIRPRSRPGNLGQVTAPVEPVDSAAEAARAAQARAEQEKATRERDALEAARRSEEEAKSAAAAAASGNLRVGLGTFETEIGALGHLEVLTSQHGDLLASRRISVQRVTSGENVRYRIRATGFSGTDEADALCRALRARGVECSSGGG